jgi:hypothetical protein
MAQMTRLGYQMSNLLPMLPIDITTIIASYARSHSLLIIGHPDGHDGNDDTSSNVAFYLPSVDAVGDAKPEWYSISLPDDLRLSYKYTIPIESHVIIIGMVSPLLIMP